MGFFSFETCDTQESIPSVYAEHDNIGRPVFLLFPNGQAPAKETDYEGYGEFGGVDVYSWLAKTNIHNIPHDATEDEIRSVGCNLESLDILTKDGIVAFYDVNDILTQYIKIKYTARHGDAEFIPVKKYSTPIPQLDGKCINDFMDDNQRNENLIRLSELAPLEFPIKLSFNENAVYEQLGESNLCEHQGFFYG